MNHDQPVPAELWGSSHANELTVPGTFAFEANDRGIFYCCPCGCGSMGFLGFRGVTDRPSWLWDGNRATPTLDPSIRRTVGCKWHGHLVAGVWRPQGDSGR